MPAPIWQKSSYCPEGNSCIHIAANATGTLHLTESSDPTHSILGTTPHTFAALIHVLKENPTHV
ncbi:DUF397 domain-containing protein [Streptomyces sp. NPDC050704]|uniref:DUF397 domain-containing protein n=1 Tax=Streptomyces sp. NPDC050704 TaxID=3157219 RepID=UPI003444390C